MFDSHIVDSVAVAPIRTLIVDVKTQPKFDPVTVTTCGPVPARFTFAPKRRAGASCVRAAERDPNRVTILKASVRVARTKPEARTRSVVSEIHSDASNAVFPAAAAIVDDTCARSRPNSVTLDDPVEARLLASAVLVDAVSNVHASVAVPTCCPDVNVICADCAHPAPAAHRIEVSDSQAVRSVPVLRSERADENETRPKFAPCTVKLAEPVEARFVRRKALSTPMSADIGRVALPARNPIVRETCRVPLAP